MTSARLRFFLPEVAFGLGAGLTIPFINLYFYQRFQVRAGTGKAAIAGAAVHNGA